MIKMDMSWSDGYELGIELIDQQHRRLFTYLEEVEIAIKNRDAETIELVVRGMVDYAITHNSFEETLMEQAQYPGLKEHRLLHEKFKKRANTYIKRLEGNVDRFKLAEQVRVFLGLWLISHVKNDDQDYAPYVRKHLKHKHPLIATAFNKLFRRSA